MKPVTLDSVVFYQLDKDDPDLLVVIYKVGRGGVKKKSRKFSLTGGCGGLRLGLGVYPIPYFFLFLLLKIIVKTMLF